MNFHEAFSSDFIDSYIYGSHKLIFSERNSSKVDVK